MFVQVWTGSPFSKAVTPLFELNIIEIKQEISIVYVNISNLHKAVIPRSIIYTLGTFSIRFFVGNGKPQTPKCHVTTALRSRLQFAVHVCTAGRAPSGKWFTARFFATKNCTASRLKVWTSFLYPFAMCLLDFWSRINELLLSFGRLKWCTSTWWKQHGGPKLKSILYSFLPY